MARLRELLSAVPTGLWVVLAIGLLLRILITVAVAPAEMNNIDSVVYVTMAEFDLFTDPVRPAGYSMLLEALHAISAGLSWTILFQHLLGLASACLLYATVQRVGAPVWAGVAAAAAILLSLDQIYLEHSILAETLFTALLTFILYCCVRSLDEPHALLGERVSSQLLWVAAAAVTLGLLAWVRTVGLVLAPFLALWFVLALPGELKARLARGLLAAVAAAGVVVAYFFMHQTAVGGFALTDGSGRVLYGRVAPFADCTKFTPPEGTEELCESTPTPDRFGSDFYIWERKSPAFRAYGKIPAEDAKLAAFASAAIVNQPLSYAKAVASDTARHFIPGLNDERLFAGTPYEELKLDHRDVVETRVQASLDSYYDAGALTIRAPATQLADLQDLLRVQPIIMLQALILSGFGIWLSAGRTRAMICLFAGTCLLLLIVPSATATYNARYAIPLGGSIIAAGALSLWVLLERLKQRARQSVA